MKSEKRRQLKELRDDQSPSSKVPTRRKRGKFGKIKEDDMR